MRILGIETASRRGTVALVEANATVCSLEHWRDNAHGESIQPLIERALATVGWALSSLDRVAVGTGPGSFTGLRVGIALAKGISEGLELPLIGVGSLAAMAAAAPSEDRRDRCPVLDARHGELFVARYTADGLELRPPQIAPANAELESLLARSPEGAPFSAEPIYLGEALPPSWGSPLPRSPETDLPHARWTALMAARAPIPSHVGAQYVRDSVAVRPRLPHNPLTG